MCGGESGQEGTCKAPRITRIMTKLAVVTLPRCVAHYRHGAVAQLGERFNGIEEVRSSILLSSTIFSEARPREQGNSADRPLA